MLIHFFLISFSFFLTPPLFLRILTFIYRIYKSSSKMPPCNCNAVSIKCDYHIMLCYIIYIYKYNPPPLNLSKSQPSNAPSKVYVLWIYCNSLCVDGTKIPVMIIYYQSTSERRRERGECIRVFKHLHQIYLGCMLGS